MSSSTLSNGHQTLPPTSDHKTESAESSKATVKQKKSFKKGYQHIAPIHTTVAPSVLSKDAPPASYRGFLNLASESK